MARGRIEVPETRGRILGIDIGTKKWGLSISDTAKRIAFPLCIIPVNGKLYEVLTKHVREQHVDHIVVGLPHHISGQEGAAAGRIRQECATLKEMFQVPVVLHDERLTTATAQDRMADLHKYPSKADDAIAAQVLLQRYLDEVDNA